MTHRIPGIKCCAVPPNVCGSSVWNLLRVTYLTPGTLRWLLDFLENLCSPCLVSLDLPGKSEENK